MYEIITTTNRLNQIVNNHSNCETSLEHFAHVDESYLEAHCYNERWIKLMNDYDQNHVYLYWIKSNNSLSDITNMMKSIFNNELLVVREYDVPDFIQVYDFTYIGFELQDAFEGEYVRAPWYVGKPTNN